MSRKIVFVGPSLHGMKREVADVEVRNPVVQGDILDAVRSGATHIGIIDGCFGTTASVWHKEILLALSKGITVLGAASMGALRAAECHPFGMIPVGKIANMYIGGELDDDGAVALLSLPAEAGHLPLTEPLVECLPTLTNLSKKGLISEEQHETLTAWAKCLHFSKRTVGKLAEPLTGDACRTAFIADYAIHRVDQKRRDALELIDLLIQTDTNKLLPNWQLTGSPYLRKALA